MQDNASPDWDDMFAEFDINGLLQLLFVLSQSRLTQGLISLHRRHFLNLSTVTVTGYLCKALSRKFSWSSWISLDRTMDQPQATRWGGGTISWPRTNLWQEEVGRWDNLKCNDLCEYHQYQYLPVIITLYLPVCSPCVVIKTRFSGQRLHPYVWPQVFLNPW